MEANTKTYLKEYRCYRPNNSKKGAATKFQLSDKEDDTLLFVESAQQLSEDKNGNAQFAWKDGPKVLMKMGDLDIGKILCVLNGKLNEAKIFHKNPLGNATFDFSVYRKDENSTPQYSIKLSSQRSGVVVRVQHLMGLDEGEILRVLLESAIRRKYGWEVVQSEEY